MGKYDPTKPQAEAMREHGIHYPFLWAVLKTTTRGFIVKNRLTGETRLIADEKL